MTKVVRVAVRRRAPTLSSRLRTAYGTARVRLPEPLRVTRQRPGFLVIGFTKTGTTTFYDRLSAHPFVAPARLKEAHFFDYNYHQGMRWYELHFPSTRRAGAFARRHGRPFLAGEASPSYVDHPLAPQRIRKDLPSVRLIVLLRNPVDRAYSHFQMSRRDGEEDLPTFEAALDAEESRLSGEVLRVETERGYRSWPLGAWSYRRRGHYAEHLERWLDVFPREQLLVLTTEELGSAWTATWARCWRFLDLPPHDPGPVRRLRVGDYPPMKEETRARLVAHFAPHNERLSDLLGLDPDWGH